MTIKGYGAHFIGVTLCPVSTPPKKASPLRLPFLFWCEKCRALRKQSGGLFLARAIRLRRMASRFDPTKKGKPFGLPFSVVRETGLEPVWKNHTPLKRARLPVPPLSLLLCSGLRFTPLCPCDGIYHTTSFPKCQYLFSIFSKIFSSFFTAFFKSHFATPSSS